MREVLGSLIFREQHGDIGCAEPGAAQVFHSLFHCHAVWINPKNSRVLSHMAGSL